MWGDKVRVGLWNAVRKAWAPRGVEVSREVQINRQYTYVAVALDPRIGRLWWTWQENMKGEEMARIREAWPEAPDIDGWVRDRAGGPKGADMQAIAAPQVVQPSYAPEPNPVERFPRVAEWSAQMTGQLSGGQERTLGIGRSWLLEPKWVMAETSAGLVREFRFMFEYTRQPIREVTPDRPDDRSERAPESGCCSPRLGFGSGALARLLLALTKGRSLAGRPRLASRQCGHLSCIRYQSRQPEGPGSTNPGHDSAHCAAVL